MVMETKVQTKTPEVGTPANDALDRRNFLGAAFAGFSALTVGAGCSHTGSQVATKASFYAGPSGMEPPVHVTPQEQLERELKVGVMVPEHGRAHVFYRQFKSIEDFTIELTSKSGNTEAIKLQTLGAWSEAVGLYLQRNGKAPCVVDLDGNVFPLRSAKPGEEISASMGVGPCPRIPKGSR